VLTNRNRVGVRGYSKGSDSMGFSCPSGDVFVTDHEVVTRIVVPPEVASRWQYISAHTFSVYVDPSSRNAYVEVNEG